MCGKIKQQSKFLCGAISCNADKGFAAEEVAGGRRRKSGVE